MNLRDQKTGSSSPGQIHLRIIDVMKRFKDGVSGGQIRQELEKEGLRPEDQTHLDRRKRDLKKWFLIQKKSTSVIVDGKKRNVVLYQYVGERKNITDEGQIGIKLRAEVIHSAHGRCQMCGRTVTQHGVALVVDHNKPLPHPSRSLIARRVGDQEPPVVHHSPLTKIRGKIPPPCQGDLFGFIMPEPSTSSRSAVITVFRSLSVREHTAFSKHNWKPRAFAMNSSSRATS